MDTYIKRQNLENRFEQPKSITNLYAAGLGIIGVCFCFQPSGFAKTISVVSLLTGGCTLAISRISHKSYVDVAFEQSEQTGDRHAQELATKVTEAAQLKQQLQRLQAEHSSMVQSEQRSKASVTDLQKQLAELDVERRSAIAQHDDLMQIQQQLLASLTTTTIESLNTWKAKLEDALSDIKRRFSDLAARIDKISASFQQDVDFFALEIAQIDRQTSLTQAADELVSILHSMYDRFSSVRVQMVKAIDVHRLQLSELENQKLEAENEAFQNRDVVPREQLQTLAKNYESRLQEFQSNLHTHKELTLNFADELEGEIKNQDPVFLRMRIVIQQQNEQIAALQTQVAEAKQIKFFDSVGWKSELANKVLHHFLVQEIVCDACSMPIREIGNDVEFFVTPRTHIGMSLVQADIDKAAESLKIPLGVKYVKVAIEGKNLKIRVPVSDRDLEKAKPEDVLARPTSQWSLYLGSEYHLFIFAASQSGKTSLADELNAMMHTRLDGDIEFNAITLKCDGNRDEEKSARFVKPRFMRSKEEYLEGLQEVYEAIDSRNRLLQVNPDKPLPRSVFQWDEYGEFYRLSSEEVKKQGKQAVISIIQTGAGLSSETGKGLSLILISQNPLVSLNGLYRPDLANGYVVIVGDRNIDLFLKSDPGNHGLDEVDLERLKCELKVFKDAARSASEKALKQAEDNGDDGALAVRRCPENYYSLVIPSKAGLKPIILYNPRPGEFTNAYAQLSIETEEIAKNATCPDCKTTETKQRGQSDRYYCLNPECQRQTFTWHG